MQRTKTDIGGVVRDIRIKRGIRQTDLAAQAGMTAAQLCNAERGRSELSVRTIQRLADALEVPVGTLFEQRRPYADLEVHESEAEYMGASIHGTARVTRPTVIRAEKKPGQIGPTVNGAIGRYLELETECGAFKHTALPLALPFRESVDGAEALADAVRRLCGVGTAIVYNWGEQLEAMGVRVLYLQLPKNGPQSLSFYDDKNDNAFLVIDAMLPKERTNFLTLFELGNVYLFTRNGNLAVADNHKNRHFAQMFAANMLMPREAIQASLVRLGLQTDRWSYELALRLKERFGVSMESFLYRLGEIRVVDKSVLKRLIDRFKSEKSKNGILYEPQPRHQSPADRGRYGDLMEALGATRTR